MHSEKISVRTYKSGCPKPTEHSFNSVKKLHEKLRDLEDDDTKDMTINQVDVLMPFSKIQVQTKSDFHSIVTRNTSKNEFF